MYACMHVGMYACMHGYMDVRMFGCSTGRHGDLGRYPVGEGGRARVFRLRIEQGFTIVVGAGVASE